MPPLRPRNLPHGAVVARRVLAAHRAGRCCGRPLPAAPRWRHQSSAAGRHRGPRLRAHGTATIATPARPACRAAGSGSPALLSPSDTNSTVRAAPGRPASSKLA